MPEKMRASHPVFGVKDVADTKFNRDNGWSPVDPSTPTTEQVNRRALNDVRRGTYDPAEHKAVEVVAVVDALGDDPAADEVVAAEKRGKARKTVVDAD